MFISKMLTIVIGRITSMWTLATKRTILLGLVWNNGTSWSLFCSTDSDTIGKTYPLYKFGFQNVIEAQLGHEAYQFLTDQNGYYSITSNASYLDQVMTYMLDFGNVSYRTLASGFDQINYAMTNYLLDSEHGLAINEDEGIYLSHKLVDI